MFDPVTALVLILVFMAGGIVGYNLKKVEKPDASIVEPIFDREGKIKHIRIKA